jgi:dihydroorotase
MRTLITNGRVIDPKSRYDDIADILIENGVISGIGKNLKAKDADVIDAKGMLVVPGLIDMHVHLREPGYEYKENIASGCRAAAHGGFTSVCCMPNTDPVADNQSVVEFIIAQSKKAALVNVFPVGAITKGSAGQELSDIGDLKTAGVIALSDDGKGVMNAEIMRRAMEYASMVELPVIAHCEDSSLSAGGVMNEGYVSTVLGLKGIPSIAETVMVARDIEIARFTGTRLHIAHISCRESVDMVRRAKADGVRISAECCPHHFTLTEEAVMCYDTSTKVNPPLRTADDVEALKKGLQDGTIDCIVTDHAPHAEAEKDVEYDYAPFGIIGLETAVGLAMAELVAKGTLTLLQLVEKMSYNPARIINIDRGYFAEGAVADITIIDPEQQWVVEPGVFFSKSKNSPFIGRTLPAKVILTFVSGKVVYNAAAGAK